MNQQDLDLAVANALGSIPIQLQETIRYTEGQYTRPSVLYRPSVVRDGSKWSALYGSNLMEGVCGFGDTPEDAMIDFDKNWHHQRASKYQVESFATPPCCWCQTDYCPEMPVNTLKWHPYDKEDVLHLCQTHLDIEVKKLEARKS